jgi:hypothetical protein
MSIVVKANGETIDKVSLQGSKLVFDTGIARDLFVVARVKYGSEAAAYEKLADTSNGYLQFLTAK